MSDMSRILIERVNVEIHAPPGAKGFPLQEKILGILNHEVFPKIEAWLEQYEKKERLKLRLPVLNLAEIKLSGMHIESDLGDQILKSFQVQIQEFAQNLRTENITSPASGAHKSDLESAKIREEKSEVYIYFLKTGALPWWFDRSEWQELKTEIERLLGATEGILPEILLRTFLEHSQALARFLIQHPPAVSAAFLTRFLSAAEIKKLESAAGFFSKKTGLSLQNLYVFLLQYLLHSKKSGKIEKQFYEKNLIQLFENQPLEKFSSQQAKLDLGEKILKTAGLPLPESVGKTNPENESFSPPISEELPDDRAGFYIENAGLILLHPFLSAFFENLQYCKKGQFLDNERQQKAALLLNYLATGATHFPEFELPLNKILCGLDLPAPLPATLILSEEEIRESESLLLSVIRHWEALKNTGVDGLRANFLCRSGKLFQNERGWKLIVQRLPQDVLLDRLPWGIGMVKLPWMRTVLSVDW